MIMPTAEDIAMRYAVCTGPPACANLRVERGAWFCSAAIGCSGNAAVIRWQVPLAVFECPVSAWVA